MRAGIYLSGTGNTKHCLEKLLSLLDETAVILPLEDEQALPLLAEAEVIFLAYPTQYSNAPIMVRDFIKAHADLWRGKQVFCLTTMGIFSGDGTGCSARLLKRCGAEIVGGLQIRMPDSISDSKLLKKSREENIQLIKQADDKLAQAAERIKAGHYPQEGLGPCAHLIGLLGQRLWFYNKTLNYSDKLSVKDTCTGCGLCAQVCPMHNLTMVEGNVTTRKACTMCYRCINLCPQKALTLLGKAVGEQYRFEAQK